KEFSPTTVKLGETSTLTFTITNTDELSSKNGWSFTDGLPAGLTIVGSPTSDCPGFTPTTTDTSIGATGNLDTGMTSCTVNVQVTADATGSYTNTPANVTVD